MGQDPDAIRQDIARTRAEMTETVEAVGYKADVPSRAKDAVSEKMENVKSKVSDTAARAKEAVAGTTPSRGEVRQQTRRAAGLVKENPLGLAIGAAAIGFLAGLAVPSTRVEDERLGPVADQVKEKVGETGQEALDRGRQVAQEVASTAADTARQRTQEHGQELADSARQSAQEVASQARQDVTGP
jgi:ElaB/YqjD/DUF883 family membrane-anchored ribosome-binding protein